MKLNTQISPPLKFLAVVLISNLSLLCKSSIQLFFLWKVVRQNDTDVTSRRMQLKKEGRGLLREANRSEGECLVKSICHFLMGKVRLLWTRVQVQVLCVVKI